MTFRCEKCGLQVGNVVSASCGKHGEMTSLPTPDPFILAATYVKDNEVWRKCNDAK